MTKKIIAIFLVIYLFIAISCISAKAADNALSINAKAFVLMDPISGRILLEKNSQEKMAMASTTKIMTAIVALEKGDLQSQIRVSPRAASIGGSSFYLKPGDVLTLEDMLFGLLLPSGNDAAVAIAEHIAGTEDKFVQMMNQKALELGALNTHFTNPHGLDDPEHYTTAVDLAVISRYALKNIKFREIVQTKTKEIKYGDIDKQIFNTNRLLWEFEGADGIKTGYTGKAGRCLVATAKNNGFHLLSVVLGSQNHFEDSKKLLNYGFENYKLKNIISKNNYLTTVNVENGVIKTVDLIAKDSITLPIEESENIKFKLIVPKKIKAPVFKGEEVGQVQVYIDDDLVTSTSLITAKDVPLKTYKYILNRILRFWTRWEKTDWNKNVKKVKFWEGFSLFMSNLYNIIAHHWWGGKVVVDPYKTGMFKTNPYAKKKPLKGSLVVVLDGTYEERGLQLIPQPSRCLVANEVHELILTDENKKPGDTVNKIAYIGFFAVKESTVITVGDEVKINGHLIGKIAGFDETHMPNHYNIVIYGEERVSGNQRNLNLDDEVIIG